MASITCTYQVISILEMSLTIQNGNLADDCSCDDEDYSASVSMWKNTALVLRVKMKCMRTTFYCLAYGFKLAWSHTVMWFIVSLKYVRFLMRLLIVNIMIISWVHKVKEQNFRGIKLEKKKNTEIFKRLAD